jgi:glutamine---fructose-6-phosphate transaminase (isomerizing)
MSLPPYITDILNQPDALRLALSNYVPEKLDGVIESLAHGAYQRIVMTGMGASFTVNYPARLILSQLDTPVSLIETSELIHYAPHTVNEKTLLWIVSQSGRSAEIQELIKQLQTAPAATTIGITNDLSSPLGKYGKPTLALYAGTEATVSTRTYVNSLAVTLLAAVQLAGGNLGQACNQLLMAADAMQSYLEDWQARVAEIKEKVGRPHSMVMVGRGPSLATVRTASFTVKEASKMACEGMEAAQFRHGPLEMADQDLTLFVYEGDARTAALNREIALEVTRHGGNALLISPRADAELPTLPIPAVPDLVLPLVEVLPLQMLTIALAEQNGIEPGKFRYIGKVTEKE